MTDKKTKPAAGEPAGDQDAGLVVPFVDPAKGLDHALLVAQELISGVAKGDKVTLPAREGSGRSDRAYTYTSCEDMLTACRLVLHEAGLLLTRTGWRLIPAGESPWLVPWVDDAGKPQVDAVMTVASQFSLLHLATGERRNFPEALWPVIPSRGQPWDKALGGALSSHWTYFLRDLLLVPRPDAHEMDARDGKTEKVTPRQAGKTEERRTEATPGAGEERARREAADAARAKAAAEKATSLWQTIEAGCGADPMKWRVQAEAWRATELAALKEMDPAAAARLRGAIRDRIKGLEDGSWPPPPEDSLPELPAAVRDEQADAAVGLGVPREVDHEPAGDAGEQEGLPF